jgi:hypothetical protein
MTDIFLEIGKPGLKESLRGVQISPGHQGQVKVINGDKQNNQAEEEKDIVEEELLSRPAEHGAYYNTGAANSETISWREGRRREKTQSPAMISPNFPIR